MHILAIDSAAQTAGVVIFQDEALLGEMYLNIGLKHSETLLPMIDAVLQCSGIALSDVDVFAATQGPGSFTGLRIGIATLKGLSDAWQKPCIGSSTLEALAHSMPVKDGIVLCAMDARRAQVYAALFRVTDGQVTRLQPDTALPIAALQEWVEAYAAQPIYLAGDGAVLCAETYQAEYPNMTVLPATIRCRAASGAAVLARAAVQRGGTPEIRPVYLRLAQAERERLAKQEGGIHP